MNNLKLLTITGVALTLGLPEMTNAATAPLVANAVIVDNSPFYSVGPEDEIGSGNYALNYPTFIDIPYAIFDFGPTTSVSSAILHWNFLGPYGGSGPAVIDLYVGNDASGTITTSDRFTGTLVDSSTYSGGEIKDFDITAFVNGALSSGEFVAARLEATVAPSSLSSYYGGQFDTPSLTFSTSAVPEPATWIMMMLGFVGLGFAGYRSAKGARVPV